jgi:translation initiation factor IF-3
MEKFEIENGELIKYNDFDKDEVVIIPEGVTVIKEEAFEFSDIYIKELIINDQITAKEVQVIDQNAQSLGTKSINEALELAYENDLDLVMVSPNAVPPVCKIMDYGKYRFDQMKKEKESKKNQKAMETKEIRVTPNIETHDFEFKSKNIKKFLANGDKVKITVRFRGREVNNSAMGEKVLNKFVEELSDVANLDKKPVLEGRNMSIILSPKK